MAEPSSQMLPTSCSSRVPRLISTKVPWSLTPEPSSLPYANSSSRLPLPPVLHRDSQKPLAVSQFAGDVHKCHLQLPSQTENESQIESERNLGHMWEWQKCWTPAPPLNKRVWRDEQTGSEPWGNLPGSSQRVECQIHNPALSSPSRMAARGSALVTRFPRDN